MPGAPGTSLPVMITVLAGGVGAARLLAAMQQVHPGPDITAVVNVGDDLVLHGLCICPDLDTVTYTLAGVIDAERGWGLAGETWQAMDALRRLGAESWFNLGDRDLGTHLYRTGRLAVGASLSQVTAEIASALDVRVQLLPVTDDELRTHVTVVDPAGDGGETRVHEVAFQRYFVERAHDVPVTAVRFVGANTARPAPGVLAAINEAERLVIAPSNPFVSIDPVLAVPGVREAVTARRAEVTAVSPIVAGAALKGPADRMLRELGHDASVVGIARYYAGFASTLVIDEADAEFADAVRAAGMECVVTGTIMADPRQAATLGRLVTTGDVR